MNPRQEAVADAALALLAERGLRGLTHRAVDEQAALPAGATSNVARSRAALLELAVRRLADRESQVLAVDEFPAEGGGVTALADALSLALHRSLTGHRDLLVARYELALEATRRPELREIYDRSGRVFREMTEAMLRAAGAGEPERQALSLVAWCDGILFTCAAGSYQSQRVTRQELRARAEELLRGMAVK
ncbi:TetR/AcrR family transcriptional regulator [Streptomyces sp. A7024]|uniref:TetR/AcrR family transcriptional regulator n=1 Tax=Streptomyces coryli TaxID=1128680 RepID=A0A6G4UD22_9ACTN|nr:TetR/AcrR family transcriptional regulator [Streptomyces coryli]NGN69278.1 TetR/AcrR family transcriptional regulator [Streptomyces coryli]